jgi:hypothetical protein
MATLKQKTAIKDITENHSPVSVAMRKAGYKPYTYRKPYNLTRSKAFQEAFKDDMLETIHKKGLNATQKRPIISGRDSKGRPTYTYIDHPDFNNIAKFLDMAYKIKGSYSPIKHISLNIKANQEQKDKASEAVRQLLE